MDLASCRVARQPFIGPLGQRGRMGYPLLVHLNFATFIVRYRRGRERYNGAPMTISCPPGANQPTNLWSNVTAINGHNCYVTADYKYGGYSSSALAGLCLLSLRVSPSRPVTHAVRLRIGLRQRQAIRDLAFLARRLVCSVGCVPHTWTGSSWTLDGAHLGGTKTS